MASVLTAPAVPHSFSPRNLTGAEMGSFSEKSDEKFAHVSIDTDRADTGAQLVAGVSLPLDPEESLRIRYGLIFR